MRIIIITRGVPGFMQSIVNKFNIIGVVESSPRKKMGKLKNIINNLSFLYYRIFQNREISLKRFAKKNNLKFRKYYEKNISIREWLLEQKPDLIFVYSMSHLLKEEIFNIPTMGTINLHPSYLPELRGPNPIFWYYYNKNLNPGVTVHFIDKGEDTGDIICQERCKISLGTKSHEIFNIIEKIIGPVLISKSIELIQNKNFQPIKQPIKYTSQRARNINSKEHINIVDWSNWELERIWHFLRGTENQLNVIPKPNFPYIGLRWSIGNYIKKSNKSIKNFKIVYERGKYFIYLKDGIIELNLKFNFVKFLKYLFFEKK